tara:strand:- start:251 stop:445 length:195 start_codon:yes stop_codon:yes gene_type:complete
MIGNNEIHINQATMREAVQLWLADQFKNPPRAGMVKRDMNVGGIGSDQFIVTLVGNTKSEEGKE